MIELHQPHLEELSFRQTMLEDAKTMSYNHAWGGTVAFPRERWASWYEAWLVNHQNRRFYRYIRESGIFVGEVAYHFDQERQIYLADILVHAPYRGKGYGGAALHLLCEAARNNGISELYDDIATDNPPLALFIRYGFSEVMRTKDYILVKKEIDNQ